MPGTRKTVPLFDLLSQGASSAPAAPTPRPAPPVLRPEVRSADGAPARSQPHIAPAPIRLSRNTAYIGVAVMIVVLVAVYVAGYKVGQTREAARAEKELAAAFGGRPNVAEPVVNPPGVTPQTPPVNTNAQPQPKPTTPGGLAPATGPVLSPFGPIPDPREKGMNYLALATLPKTDCEAAIRFLYENTVEVIAVPVDAGPANANNPTRYTLYAFPGFAADQLRSAAAQSLEANIARLGQAWVKEHRGTSDFRRPQWTLKK